MGWKGGTYHGREAVLWESGGIKAEWLVLVGGQRRAVTFKVTRNAATCGARAVTQRLDTAFSLQFR